MIRDNLCPNPIMSSVVCPITKKLRKTRYIIYIYIYHAVCASVENNVRYRLIISKINQTRYFVYRSFILISLVVYHYKSTLFQKKKRFEYYVIYDSRNFRNLKIKKKIISVKMFRSEFLKVWCIQLITCCCKRSLKISTT